MIDDLLTARKAAPTADFSLAIINVVFLLLFFFILTGSVVQRSEMEVRAPFTKNLPLERLPRPLIVISQNNELFLDGLLISEQNLNLKISRSPDGAEPKFKTLNILADGKLSAKSFLKIVDRLRKSGLPVRIVTVRTIKDKSGI